MINSFKVWTIEWIARHATALAAGEGYESVIDTSEIDARNAIAHAHVSADWTRSYGREDATWLGNTKELGSTGPDSYKDQFNNEIGRRIAEWMEDNGYTPTSYTAAQLDEIMDALVLDALYEGELITDARTLDGNPIDSRITNQDQPTWEEPSVAWESITPTRNYDHEIPDTGTSDIFIPDDWLASFDPPSVSPYGRDVQLPPIPWPEISPLPNWVPGVITPFHNGENAASPIVLDIDMSGTIELAALNGTGSVMWDIDQDGFREASGWITGGDGLLCIDLNSDGTINDHGELFGGANGYVTLDAYDTNNDNAITSADTDFGDFLVWVDTNADGYSQSGELHTLASLSITSIATSYSNVNYTIAGNQVSFESTFVMGGNSYKTVDAFFNYDNVNSEYDGDYTLDIRTLFLPDLRGYGALPDLHIAMSQNEDLLDLVQSLASTSAEDLLDPEFRLQEAVREILFKWAGVTGVSPGARGGTLDARTLAFLEEFMDEPFVQPLNVGNPSNPGGFAPAHVSLGWQAAFDALYARLLLQTSFGEIFDTAPTYNSQTDEITGSVTLNFDVIEDIVSAHSTYDAELAQVWVEIFNFIDKTVGIGNLSAGDETDLTDLLADYDGSTGLTYGALEAIVQVTSGASTNGTSSADVLMGSMMSDTYYGQGGHDVLTGDLGNDFLVADGGNDFLVGGIGDDTLYGGTGDDTFVFRAGDGSGTSGDAVYESSGEGTDTLFFEGVLPADIRMWAVSGGLYINYSATDRIFVGSSSDSTGSLIANHLEYIKFDDGTVWNLASGVTMTDTDDAHSIYGTPQADVIDGRGGNDGIQGFDGNDTINGGSGSDYLYGGNGADVLTGGTGTDNLFGGAGNDDYVFATGDGVSGNYDFVTEYASEGTDRIILSGINWADVRMWTTYAGHLYIQYGTNDQIFVMGGTGGSGETTVTSLVEQIVFSDTTLDLTQGLHLVDTDTAHDLYGSNLSDILDGRGGGEFLFGFGGNDILKGGAGSDYLYGGSGTDTADYSSAAAGVTASLSAGTASNDGDGGSDSFNSVENLTGSAYNDTLTGDGNANVIDGGAGTNSLTGGGGADIFAFDPAVTMNNIQDFSTAQGDKLDISSLIEGYDPLTHAITDWVQITESGGNSALFVDADGTGSTYGFNQVASLIGATGLTDEDALLTAGTLIAA